MSEEIGPHTTKTQARSPHTITTSSTCFCTYIDTYMDIHTYIHTRTSLVLRSSAITTTAPLIQKQKKKVDAMSRVGYDACLSLYLPACIYLRPSSVHYSFLSGMDSSLLFRSMTEPSGPCSVCTTEPKHTCLLAPRRKHEHICRAREVFRPIHRGAVYLATERTSRSASLF